MPALPDREPRGPPLLLEVWSGAGADLRLILAALGAEVIKIESRARPDLSQRDTAWEELNPSKKSITLNLKDEPARDLARRLIAMSDVVVENFSAGVMDRLGLGYQRLSALNPGLIMASSFGAGPDRPRARARGLRHLDPVLHRLGRALGPSRVLRPARRPASGPIR